MDKYKVILGLNERYCENKTKSVWLIQYNTKGECSNIFNSGKGTKTMRWGHKYIDRRNGLSRIPKFGI